LEKPVVSIILPSFNSEDYISDTLESIISQTFKKWELVITDDNSNDNTIDIIIKYINKDPRIKLLRLNANYGAGVARNNSIKKANGRYIAFCDSDDIWLPNKLELQIKFLSKMKIPFTFSSYTVTDIKGVKKKDIIAKSKLTYKQCVQNNHIACFTAIYDSKKLGKIYMSKMRNRQDWSLWLKIMKKIKETKGMEEVLGIYRERKNSISSNKIKLIKYTWWIYNKELKFSYLKSFIYLFVYLFIYFKRKIL